MQPTNKVPPKWKIGVLMWICIYPLINVLLYVMPSSMDISNQFLRTLILTVILVPVMVVISPKVQAACKMWLIK